MKGKIAFPVVAASVAIATGLLFAPTTGYSTEQGEQRREARDTKQGGRQEARETKAECRAGDEKNRAECRQEKRDTKARHPRHRPGHQVLTRRLVRSAHAGWA